MFGAARLKRFLADMSHFPDFADFCQETALSRELESRTKVVQIKVAAAGGLPTIKVLSVAICTSQALQEAKGRASCFLRMYSMRPTCFC